MHWPSTRSDVHRGDAHFLTLGAFPVQALSVLSTLKAVFSAQATLIGAQHRRRAGLSAASAAAASAGHALTASSLDSDGGRRRHGAADRLLSGDRGE